MTESPKVRRGRAAPFYQPSDKVQTSAQIISEARTAIKHGSLRAVPTRRPETPQEKQRILFGDQSTYDSINRPPSSFSIGSRQYESESRPVSGKQRLSPLDHKPRLSIAEEDVPISPKPPTDPNRPYRYSAGKSRALQHSTSVEPTAAKLLDQYSPDDDSSATINRRVQSGPKERTPRFTDNSDVGAIGQEPVSARRATSGGQTRKVTRPSSLDMSDQLADVHVGSAGGSKYYNALSPASPDGDSSAHSVRTTSNSDTDSPSRVSLAEHVVRSGEGDPSQHKGKKVKASEEPASQEIKDIQYKSSTRSTLHTQKSAARDSRPNSGSTSRRQSGAIEESSDSRQGSAGRRDEESEEERQLYDAVLTPVLQQMAACRAPTDEASTTQLTALTDQLFKLMSQYNLLGKNCKRRSAVLKILFKLLDSDTPELLVKLATLILSLKVSGNNLVNVSKLVLMVCKAPSNDDILLQNNIPDLLLDVVETSEVSSSLDAFVYLIGAIKFLSSNPVIVKRLVKRRLVRILGSVIHRVNKLKSRNVYLNEQLVGPVLVQVTAALRNSADVQGVWNQFLESQLISELFSVLSAHVHDYDLALNVARIFSKLSGHAECCRVLSSQPSHFSVCLALLSTHQAKEDLVVRVAFVLGNVTARDEASRQNLISQPSYLDVLLNALQYYVDCDKQSSKPEDKYEDVLVKVVRVIANLSISEHVGPHIAASERCIDLLQHILDKKELATSEELILNTITAINNLSYFDIDSSAVTKAQLSLAKGLIRYVDDSHIEGLCEATRVLGNLSRTRTVRELLMQFAVGEKLVRMLSSSQSEVVYTSCGVLINLMLDEDKRYLLRKDDNKGISLLLEVLRDFAHADWLLATLVCQVLWNYCSRTDNVSQWLGWQQAQQLAALLDECLDEESAVTRSEVSEEGEKEMEEYVLEQWRSEFCPVATALLTKLESSLPDLEPLQANSRPG